MVHPRLGILSTIDREVSRLSDVQGASDFSGELVSIDPATGLATVDVRSKRVVGETVMISGVGVLFENPTYFLGFDVFLRVPSGSLNGDVYAIGPILRGSVLFNTTALPVSSHAVASDPVGPFGSTTAFSFALNLLGTAPVLIQSIAVALDSVDGARPFLRLNAGSGDIDWFGVATETGEVVFSGDAPLLLRAGTSLTVSGLAVAFDLLKAGSWRAALTAGAPPSGQALTTTDSPLPLARIRGTTG